MVITEPDNEYIVFEASGLKVNDTLEQKTSKTLTIKVTFKDIAINIMEPSISKLTVTLDFSQIDVNGSSSGGIVSDYTGILYSKNVLKGDDDTEDNYIHLGDSIERIKGYAMEDNSTLGNVFLKHNITNGQVKSNEVCFIKDGLHCLNGEGNGIVYETNKTLLITVFGESVCNVYGSSIGCNDGSLRADAYSAGSVLASDDSVVCSVYDDGSSACRSS